MSNYCIVSTSVYFSLTSLLFSLNIPIAWVTHKASVPNFHFYGYFLLTPDIVHFIIIVIPHNLEGSGVLCFWVCPSIPMGGRAWNGWYGGHRTVVAGETSGKQE